MCWWLVLVFARCNAEKAIATKFSLRNLSGGSIGVWWLNGKNLVPQQSVAIRNSSSIEINSFRGHQFVVRRRDWKEKLNEEAYEGEEEEESILTIGSTNDLVIVDSDLGLERRDARWGLRRGLRLSVASPVATADDVVRGASKVLETWRLAWLAEADLRRGMKEDYAEAGGDVQGLEAPVVPPEGWPETDPGLPEVYAREAVLRCGGKLPGEPSFYGDESSSSREAFEEAYRDDGHDLCGRWALVGECNKNPSYMLSVCSRSCELWNRLQRGEEDARAVARAGRQRDEFLECVAEALDRQAMSYRGALSAEHNAKSTFSEALRNATCAAASPRAPSRGPHRGTQTFPFVDEDNQSFAVSSLFAPSEALPAASISMVEGFATDDECRAAMDSARGKLRPATVNSEANPTSISSSRRAHAATLEPDPEGDGHASKLWRRAIRLANNLTGYGLDIHGQEPFSVIYYNGSKDGLPDEYRPHCDGSCDGSPYLHGGRVATLLLYCATPTRGGATTFTSARTVATPNPNDAVFFSYYDSNTGNMDAGLTEHSGCPVLEGEKWVMTLWMRLGVSSQDKWDAYDPTGARHFEKDL